MGVLTERLDGGAVICAEGYLFELERQAGAFVPEVVLEHPDAVLQLHREFLRAGSDVSVAFTYYAHREKNAFNRQRAFNRVLAKKCAGVGKTSRRRVWRGFLGLRQHL